MGIRSWFEPRSSDERVARREQLVNILALTSGGLGMLYLLALAFIALVLGGEVSLASLLGGVGAIVLAASAYGLSRRGYALPAAILIVFGAALVGLYSAYVRGTLSVAAVMLFPAVLFAGVAIGGRAGALTALIELVLYGGLTLAQMQGWILPLEKDLSPLTGLVLVTSVLVLIALVLWLTLAALDSFLARAQEHGRALQSLADDKDRLLSELRARDEAQRRLLEMVHELGAPIIPLAEGIIAMPLVGTIDSARAQEVMAALLRGVARLRARAALIDITGVSMVDTGVANALLQTAQGVRLLGATPILVGIRSEVALALVELGLDMQGIVTRSNLQEGLVYALQLTGAQIVRRAAKPDAGKERAPLPSQEKP